MLGNTFKNYLKRKNVTSIGELLQIRGNCSKIMAEEPLRSINYWIGQWESYLGRNYIYFSRIEAERIAECHISETFSCKISESEEPRTLWKGWKRMGLVPYLPPPHLTSVPTSHPHLPPSYPTPTPPFPTTTPPPHHPSFSTTHILHLHIFVTCVLPFYFHKWLHFAFLSFIFVYLFFILHMFVCGLVWYSDGIHCVVENVSAKIDDEILCIIPWYFNTL